MDPGSPGRSGRGGLKIITTRRLACRAVFKMGSLSMDKKQRVLDCIDGKPVDKIPVSFWHHFVGQDNYGLACIRRHKEIYESANLDFIKMNSNGYYPVDFGVSVQTPQDWIHIRPPKKGSAYFQEQIELIRRMKDAIQDEACVFYVVYAAYSFLLRSYGKEMCDAHLRDPAARKFLLPALEAVGDFVAELCQELIVEGGATGIFEAYSSNSRFSPSEYTEWIRPQDEKQMRACEDAGKYNIVHLCGGVDGRNHVDTWADYRGSTIHWDQHLDGLSLAEGRVMFPNKRAIMGGFDNRPGTLLYTGTKEKIQAMTEAYVRSAGRTGFLLSADCTLAPNVPYEHLRWVSEALEKL